MNVSKIVLLFLVQFSSGYFLDERSACANNPNYCRCPNDQFISCIDFPSFDLLDFTSGVTPQPIVDFLQLHPANQLNLDSSLDLTGIELSSQCQLVLAYINWFEYADNPFRDFPSLKSLKLSSSNLRFLFLAATLDQRTCNRNQLGNLATFFSQFEFIQFGDGMNYGELCPLVFSNANIDTLEINNLNNFNQLDFMPINSQDAISLQSRIKKLEIRSSEISRLNERLIDKYVFENLEDLFIVESQLGYYFKLYCILFIYQVKKYLSLSIVP